MHSLAACYLMLQMAVSAVGAFGVDLDGHPVKRLATAGSEAVVLFFTATDCPIANRYLPELEQLAKDEAKAGLTIWFVYPNPGDTAKAVRAHQAAFGIPGNVILDTQHTLVRMAHATVTPEATVFVPGGKVLREVYRGRIDDRYARLGGERPQATHHDLDIAIQAVLGHQPVPPAGGPPVGCAIMPLDRSSTGR